MISADEKPDLEALWRREGLAFPGLIDADTAVIRRFGLLNEAAPTLPHPAALVLDRGGVIRWLRVDENYRVRPQAAEILAALDALEE